MKNVLVLSYCLFFFFLATPGYTQVVPAWVTNLAYAYLGIDVDNITFWEETQMTFYNIDGNGDSTTVNALHIKGVTDSGNTFVGKIPVTNQAVAPVGSLGITGESCEGQCGCQTCYFRASGPGCFCDTVTCVTQPSCNCWCKHTVTKE